MNYAEIASKLSALGLSVLPVSPYQDPRKVDKAVSKIKTRQYKTTSWYGKQYKEVCKSVGIQPVAISSFDSADEYYQIYDQCLIDKDQQPIVSFTGKNPSFLAKNGYPKTIRHAEYQSKLPSQDELKEWFANPQNGIGCLGSNRYRWLDLDRKHFDSQEKCDRALDSICAPDIKANGWLEQTHSGGYRLLVDCGDQGTNFTNFSLSEGGDHVGELLGSGRFAVLAPTIGVSGNPYTNISYGSPVPLNELNIFTTTKKQAAAVIKPSMPSTSRISSISAAIELFSCVTPAVQSIITGNAESDDRSSDLTKAAKELYGWENWLKANGVNYVGSADNLINDCADNFGIDGDRVERIKKTINPDSCLPACVIRGDDESAQKRVKRLQYALSPVSKIDLRYVSKLEEPSDIDLLSLLPKKYIEAVKYGIDKPLSIIATIKGLAVATEAYLTDKHIGFTGSAKEIFDQFCKNQEPQILDADFDGIPCDESEKIDIPSIKKLLNAHDQAQIKLQDRIDREVLRQEREKLKAQFEADEICNLAANITTINNVYGDRFSLNELTNEPELDGEFFDMDRSRAMFALELNIEISKADACDVIRAIAEKNSYHPIQNYLDDCYKKHGDNTNILSDLAAKCFGSTNPLYEVFLQKTLIAAVARIYEPSCKVDSVLTLVGKQGYQKSTFFEALAGVENFTDNLDKELNNKDNLMRLHRKWICEIGEIDRVANSKYEGDLKNFITIKTDLLRLPYAISTKEFKRRFLFVGTSNRADFLTDPTGDRRYWLVQVAKEIDVEYVKEYRDQIWAAAVSLYKSGAKWWLSDLEKAASDRNNERYRSDSPWMPLIAQFCEGREKISCTEILYHIERETAKHNHSMKRDVINCLMRLGFTKSGGRHRVNIDGNLMAVNSWLAPTDLDLGGSLGGSSLDADVVSISPPLAKLGGSLGGSPFDADIVSNSEEMIHLIHQKQVKVFSEKNICPTQENTKPDTYIFEENSFESKTLDHVDHYLSNVVTATKNDDPSNDPPHTLSGSSGSSPLAIGDRITWKRSGVIPAMKQSIWTIKSVVSDELTIWNQNFGEHKVTWQEVDRVIA